MNVVITDRCSEATQGTRRHVEEKVQKLSRYFKGTTKVEVILDREGDSRRVELLISLNGGGQVVCHCQHSDFYAALDLALDKAEKQLTRHKEKRRSHRSRTSVGLQDEDTGPMESEDGESEDGEAGDFEPEDEVE